MPVRRQPVPRFLAIAVLLCAVSALASCDDSSSGSQASSAAGAAGAGFEAAITGAYQASLSGTGVLEFLPGAGFEKKGYFVLADGRGVRLHGVTFVLPPGTTAGTHALKSPKALEIGTAPSVRVDRIMGSTVAAADRKTSGALVLTAFPGAGAKLKGAEVAGHFEFETETPKGKRIKVEGRFAFEVP